jgi:hypothetical protein
LGRLKGRPLSLTPMYVQRDDHATGLIRLLSIAIRVLTLLEFVGRRQLATEGAQLAGLYAGNTKRDTARPTAERLLEAFREITLTIVEGAQQTYRHLTALRPLQQRILEILGFSSAEFIPIKPLVAKGSGAPGSYAGHSRSPSPHRGRPPSRDGSDLSPCDSA